MKNIFPIPCTALYFNHTEFISAQQSASTNSWRYFSLTNGSLPYRIFRFIEDVFLLLTRQLTIQQLVARIQPKSSKISPDAAKQYLNYAKLIPLTHKTDLEWLPLTPFKLISPKMLIDSFEGEFSKGIKVHDHYFLDEQTGLKIFVFYDSEHEQVILSFGARRATDCEINNPIVQTKARRQIEMEGTQLILGTRSQKLCKEYAQFFDELRMSVKFQHFLQNKTLVLTGMCWGGLAAQLLALKTKTLAVCFNTLPLGAGLQVEVGKKRLRENAKYVTHISTKGDITSDAQYIKVLGFIISLIGIRFPRNFGRHFTIDQYFKHIYRNHTFVLESLCRHCYPQLFRNIKSKKPLSNHVLKKIATIIGK